MYQNIITSNENITAIFDTQMEIKSRYIQIKNIFKKDNLYLLFAEPIPNGNKIKWQTQLQGEIRSFDNLSIDEQEIVKIVLHKKILSLRKVLPSNPNNKKFLKQILEVPTKGDIHLVQDGTIYNVVLTFWGYRKNEYNSEKNIISNMIGVGSKLIIKLKDDDAISNFPIEVTYYNQKHTLLTDNSGKITIDDILKDTIITIEFNTDNYKGYKTEHIFEEIKIDQDEIEKEFILEKKYSPPPPPPPLPKDNFFKRHLKWLLLLLLLLLGLIGWLIYHYNTIEEIIPVIENNSTKVIAKDNSTKVIRKTEVINHGHNRVVGSIEYLVNNYSTTENTKPNYILELNSPKKIEYFQIKETDGDFDKSSNNPDYKNALLDIWIENEKGDKKLISHNLKTSANDQTKTHKIDNPYKDFVVKRVIIKPKSNLGGVWKIDEALVYYLKTIKGK